MDEVQEDLQDATDRMKGEVEQFCSRLRQRGDTDSVMAATLLEGFVGVFGGLVRSRSDLLKQVAILEKIIQAKDE